MLALGKKDIVSVDFDGVLHHGHGDETTNFGKPVKNAINWLRDLIHDPDMLVVIHSARLNGCEAAPGAVQEAAIKKWLLRYGLEESLVGSIIFIAEKPPASIYVDDRAYRFTGENFPDAAYITEFKSWVDD
jgi:hypothetical protein